MTIESEVSRNDYLGNGSTAVYSYTFKIFSASDLLVTQQNDIGIETALTLNEPSNGFTVTGAGSSNGGSITLTSGNLPSGFALTIRRKRPLLQQTAITNQGAYFANLHEDAFDKLTMVDQQQQDEIDRSIKLRETEAEDGELFFPTVVERANKFLAFDENGDFITTVGVFPEEVFVSEFMEDLLAAETSAAAKAILDLVVEEPETVVPAGTRLIFPQAAVPTGWTKYTGFTNGRTFRLADTGGSVGGSFDVSGEISLNHSHTVDGHQHTINHRHVAPIGGLGSTGDIGNAVFPNSINWNQGTSDPILVNRRASTETGSFVAATHRYLKTRDTDTSHSGIASPGTNSALTNVTLAHINVVIGVKD